MDILEGPNAFQMENIRNELGEDGNRMEHNLNILKEWILREQHFNHEYNKNILSVFLRGCKHDLERTKRKMKMYCEIRANFPDLYADRDPNSKQIIKAAKILNITPLPKLTEDGYRITIYKLTNNNANDYEMKDIIRHAFMIADIRVEEETPIAGDIFIFDAANFTAGHCVKYVSPFLKTALTIAHEAYPQRLKQIHVVNASSVVEKIMGVTKMFLREKMRSRFVVHHSTRTLDDYFSRDVLPKEYTGAAGSHGDLVEKWQKCLINHSKWFEEQEAVNTKKRISEYSSLSCRSLDNFGLTGSFRKLEID